MKPGEPGGEILVFAGFSVDPRLRRLLGPDGVPIPLGARAFDTLLYLVEHPNQLVDKHTLMQAIWPSAVVEENNLNQNISTIRRALGEVPGDCRFIVTVPGRGFRFVPTVRRVESSTTAATPRAVPAKPEGPPFATRLVGIAAISLLAGSLLLLSIRMAPQRTTETVRATETALAAAAIPAHPAVAAASVAVVPFANMTGESGKEYFSDGLAEELISELARVPGLKVPARSSSFAYKGHNVDARQIGRDLGVENILEGSVVSAGERIRVQVQLISAQSGFQVWSQSYDRKFGDVFELEDDICAKIVQALMSTIAVPMPAMATRTPPTRDPEAYRLYLQGLAANGRASDVFLQQSIARDPHFAPAYAARAEGHVFAAAFAGLRSVPIDPNALKGAEQEAKTALALDPSLAQAHTALGMLNAWRGDWRGAESSFESAQALGPSDPSPASMRATYVLQTTGHMREALRALETEYAGAPTNWELIATLSATYNLMGMEAQARRYADLTVALGGGNAALLHVVKQWEAIRHARYEEAAALELSTGSAGAESDAGRATIRQAYAALGQPAQRPAAARALRALFEELSASQGVARYKEEFIILPVMLGDLDLAFDAANRSLDEFARFGTVGLTWGVLWMPQMRAFRQDSRFQDLSARLKLLDYWKQYGPPDDCQLVGGRIICR
jgi:TolB-like protein/DNA-binding winged helix-turn-helix (wHTH) protein